MVGRRRRRRKEAVGWFAGGGRSPRRIGGYWSKEKETNIKNNRVQTVKRKTTEYGVMLHTKREIKASVLKGQKRRGKRITSCRSAAPTNCPFGRQQSLDRISSDSGVSAVVAYVCVRESINYYYESCQSIQHGVDVLQMICFFFFFCLCCGLLTTPRDEVGAKKYIVKQL